MGSFNKELVVLGATLYQLKLYGAILQIGGSLEGHFIFFPKIFFLCCLEEEMNSREKVERLSLEPFFFLSLHNTFILFIYMYV
jgi:hypothetical protein